MFVRFEHVERPNSYNDSPISCLSWMKHEADIPPLPNPVQASALNPLDNLQSPTSHLHPLVVTLPSDPNLSGHALDLNNNATPQHNHRPYRAQAQEDNFSLRSNLNDLEDEYHPKDGWLAVGNLRGIVGVSYTSTKAYAFSKSAGFVEPHSLDHDTGPQPPLQRHLKPPSRTNYNLRGHRSEILFVRWNEPYQKLATCDENGVIFIWIKYEGRWSIELINDRNTRVTDIAWSHDGRMALICYMDGFVLVGSVSGQRYWSSMLNLNDCHITCDTWTPTDQQVLFGTSNGHILVISVHGTFVTQVVVQECVEICALAWSCPRFTATAPRHAAYHPWLAVSFADGSIFLMRNYDDLDPRIISTDLLGLRLDWSSDGRMLAVGGHKMVKWQDGERGEHYIYHNVVHFYTVMEHSVRRDSYGAPACLVPCHTVVLEYNLQPLSAISWGNYDRRIYVACGQLLYVGWVFLNIPTLSFFARHKIYQCLRDQSKVNSMPVPEPIKCSIAELFSPTICCYLPDYSHIRDFVFRPPPNQLRLYCTLIRHEDETSLSRSQSQSSVGNTGTSMVDNATYILYLEYLGGLVPILKGKRSSKIKTEFAIYDPELPGDGSASRRLNVTLTPARKPCLAPATSASQSVRNSSDSESEESFIFPYLTPKTRRRLRTRSAQLRRYFRGTGENLAQSETDLLGRRSSTPSRSRHQHFVTPSNRPPSSSIALVEMPEKAKIVTVASNIWGTKFKFIGLSPMLPRHLGSMTYRTSFLHLQPRQMALVIKELNSYNTKTQLTLMPSSEQHYTGGTSSCAVSSDSEDDYGEYGSGQEDSTVTCSNTPAIAPMTPLKTVRNSMLLTTVPMDEATVQPAHDESHTQSSQTDAQAAIEARLASALRDEFLTLQINEPTYGRATYSMEITAAPNRRQPREPERYEGPLSPDSFEGQAVAGPSGAIVKPVSTMLQQFKHQTFQTESPKHVPKPNLQPREHSTSAQAQYHSYINSAVSKLSSPNISPSKNIRQKISSMKESPRKSSVSYCSSEFSAPAKSYIGKLLSQANCDTASQAKFKSCSSEAYAAAGSGGPFLASNLSPEPFSAETASTIATQRANLTGHHALTMDLFSAAAAAASTNYSKTDSCPSSRTLDDSANKTKSTHSTRGPILTSGMQAYHIYDDTNSSSATTAVCVPGSKSESPSSISAAQRRRLDFRSNSSKLSKSFDSPLKTPGDPYLDSFEQEQETNSYLQNVEQVVKLLSDKLSAAAAAKEIESARLGPTVPEPIVSPDNATRALVRRNSLPHNSRNRSTTPQPPATPLRTRKSRERSSEHTEGLAAITMNVGICRNASLTSLGYRHAQQHRSLPASPSPGHHASELSIAPTAEVDNGAKRRSNGKSFFQSPNVLRKMRRKLSYLDCSSEEEHSSDEDDVDSLNERLRQNQFNRFTTGSAASSAQSTPSKESKVKRRFHRRRVHHEEGESKEFVLHNKAPLWNEVTQVYQLDFGGRVTQESAKNFQIENQGRQVMQFGRIDKNAYTLDFEYPFSAVQALSVALANVTQRFK